MIAALDMVLTVAIFLAAIAIEAFLNLVEPPSP